MQNKVRSFAHFFKTHKEVFKINAGAEIIEGTKDIYDWRYSRQTRKNHN